MRFSAANPRVVSLVNRPSSDIWRFLKSHWPHIVLAIPGAIVVTAFHETAHCVAVWLQGGTVTSFVCLPSRGKWGEMRYEFAASVPHSGELIAIAPYIASLALCLVAMVLAARGRRWSFSVASAIFVWLFIVPVADIANASIPYLFRNAANDLRQAFGEVNLTPWVLAVTMTMALVAVGYWIQSRLYRERAVRLPAYGILAFAGFFTILFVTSL